MGGQDIPGALADRHRRWTAQGLWFGLGVDWGLLASHLWGAIGGGGGQKEEKDSGTCTAHEHERGSVPAAGACDELSERAQLKRRGCSSGLPQMLAAASLERHPCFLLPLEAVNADAENGQGSTGRGAPERDEALHASTLHPLLRCFLWTLTELLHLCY